MNIKIRYKVPIPTEMRTLYERAFKIAFEGCKISWWNPKLVQLLDIKNSEIEVEDNNVEKNK